MSETATRASLLKRQSTLASTTEQLRILNQTESISPFETMLASHQKGDLRATGIDIFQINVGRLCNQVCAHCHVDAGPDRKEIMSRKTMEECLRALRDTTIPKVDITGGAPEMNPNFRWLVKEIRELNRHVIDRYTLTVMFVKGNEDLPDFFAENSVEIIASLPYFQERETDRQRGTGVFQRSIESLKRLNEVGYGRPDSGLLLNLVHNPVGAFLPGSQKAIEQDFKRSLQTKYGIQFNSLYCITNMPISRFLEFLLNSGNYNRYMEKLAQSFNPSSVDALMCRNTLSVGWDGRLYDCDFNQMLDLGTGYSSPTHIRDFDFHLLSKRRIVTNRHCYGCTAGAGSSCGGAIANS